MRKIALSSAFISAVLVAMLPGTPAQALNIRSWVSSTGGGTTCTRAQPCADFQTAHDATNPEGEINCVDAGDFATGFLTIRKSITIDCGGTFGATSLASLAVNGTGIVVRLRNLSLQGGGFGGTVMGINFINGAALYVENCVISGYQGASFGKAIVFAPPDGVTASLYVTDSIIINNGAPAHGVGIGIQPGGSGSARVVIERTRVEGNTYGIYAAGGAGGLIIVQVRDSVVANSAVDGISAYASTGQSTVAITLDHSSSLLNGGNGIVAQGPGSVAVLANSTVMSNITGLSSGGGGAILSYQNNQLTGNATDGSPTGMLSVK